MMKLKKNMITITVATLLSFPMTGFAAPTHAKGVQTPFNYGKNSSFCITLDQKTEDFLKMFTQTGVMLANLCYLVIQSATNKQKGVYFGINWNGPYPNLTQGTW